MEAVLLIARLILAGVFGVAGIAKLFDREGSEKAVAGFGVPENLAKPAGVALPLGEIAVAVSLLPLQTAWFGAVGALALLLAFVGGISYNMAQGKAPDCHCFGQIHSEPVGWSTLIRNLILSAIAAFVVYSGRENAGTSALTWLNNLTAGEAVNLFLSLAVIGFLVYLTVVLKQIVKQQAALQRQLEVLQLGDFEHKETVREDAAPPMDGLPVGALAPEFALPDLRGKNVSLDNLLENRKPLLLVFVGPNCRACHEMLADIKEWRREFGEKVSVVLITSGKAKENREKFGDEFTLLLQEDFEIGKRFYAVWTPSAIFINADGSIGARLAVGDAQIKNLVNLIRAGYVNLNGHAPQKLLLLAQSESDGKPKINAPAPDFSLPDLDGRELSPASFRGKNTLLLFWRPNCSYCLKMIENLREWERFGLIDANLVLISHGDAKTLRDLNLKSPILLEKSDEIQRLYGIEATPSAVLLDAEGKIVSEMTVGEDAAFALVGHYKN